jgi:hypothetical protein
MTSPIPSDEELKRAVLEAARLQTKMINLILNVGSVVLAIALCVVVIRAAQWVIDSVAG